MNAKFVHVAFNFEGTDPPIKELEGLFSAALDWVRYGNESWILYTTTELDTWRDRIRATKAVPGEVSFLLVEFGDYYSGYLHDWIWEWLHKSR